MKEKRRRRQELFQEQKVGFLRLIRNVREGFWRGDGYVVKLVAFNFDLCVSKKRKLLPADLLEEFDLTPSK